MPRLTALVAFLVVTFVAATALAAITLRYHNRDSRDYEAKAVCSGSATTVKFGASRTASVTIQGSAPCKVTLGGQTVTFEGAATIEIKDGRIIFQ